MSSRQRLEVPAGAAPVRLDKLLVDAIGLSRARAKRLLEADAVRVNGRRSKKGALVQPGDVVEVAEEAEALKSPFAPPVPQPELGVLGLKVVFEDAALLVVDKPAGMPSHPLAPGETGTAANFIAARYPECVAANPEDPREAGLVHRLDIETSGLLVAARTPEAYRSLRAAFSRREVEKRYLAATCGPLADEGEIELPVAHAPGDKRRMVAVGSETQAAALKARPARTTFKVVERKGDHSLLEVGIDTGVMHQIRVHLSAIGAPILGDALYGGPAVPGLARHFLHAARIALVSPASGARTQVESPLPDPLRRAWDALPAS